jgi:CheY-like chemotaxis protein
MSRQPLNVLLVDDDPHSAAIFELLMNHHGFPYHVAETPAIALDYLANHRPDVVLIDLFLPGMDGFQTLTRVREIIGSDTCRLIATTAYYTSETQHKVLEYGFDGYLPKPFIEDAFFNALYGQPIVY